MFSPLTSTPRVLVAVLLVTFATPAGVEGQTAEVRSEENFRAEPNGTVLGQLEPGTRIRVVGQEGNWSRVTLEGFVWERSMQILREDGFDLVISVPEGENVRDEPAGRIAGRFVRGALLEEIERVPGWVRVRRTGWIWTPSIQLEEGAAPPTQAPAPAADAPPAAPPPPEGATQWLRPRGGEAPILSAPDGDTLGRARDGAELRVLARQGNWVRVQMEGWIWQPGDEVDGEAEAAVQAILPDELTADPDAFRGRLVEMTLQFISLERAEQVRTDFYEGEPFLLTRSVEGERVFVYVAVPPEWVEDATRLSPLERIRVMGRVRSGAATLTGSPILDMMEIEVLR